MGSLGENVQTQVTNLISDANIRSTIDIKKVIRTAGSRGGYDSNTETNSSTTSIYAIPSNVVKVRAGLEKMGDLQEGEIRFLILADQSVDTNDKVTFESVDYHIREVKEIFFNEVVIAKSIILSKIQ